MMNIFWLIVIGLLLGTAIGSGLKSLFTIPAAACEAGETCTRRAPHICRVNGPCNGWPRPTPRHECECEDCMEPGLRGPSRTSLD